MGGEPDPFRAVGALADTARRELYEYVVSQDHAVGRDEAADATGLARHSARFHLDRLVEEGLLSTEFRRLSGRSGPGAGRPAKLYRRAEADVAVTLPPRRYDLAAQVLAAGVERSLRGIPLPDALAAVALETGRHDGAASPTGHDAGLDAVGSVLADRGYEPREDDRGLVLANCPFDSLARAHTALVCGINRDYVTGVVEGVGCADRADAVLDPSPERCCVRVRRAD